MRPRIPELNFLVVNEAPIALIDLDGTVADFVGQMRRDLERLRAPEEPALDEIWPAPEHLEARMDLIKAQPGWWRRLPVLEQGMRVIDLMRHLGFELHVLTKAPLRAFHAWTEKVEWCSEHLPDAFPTITHNKSLVYGHVLFDDYPKFMQAWLDQRPRGLGLMLKNEFNEDYEHPQVIKFSGDNLGQVKRALEIARDREPGEDLDLSSLQEG